MSRSCGYAATNYRLHLLPRQVRTRCAYCGAADRAHLPLCQGCKIARYCNRDCQLNHWNGRGTILGHVGVRAHKNVCVNVYDRTHIECPDDAEFFESKERAEKVVTATIVEHLRQVDYINQEAEEVN
jgi:hypothetical protein